MRLMKKPEIFSTGKKLIKLLTEGGIQKITQIFE